MTGLDPTVAAEMKGRRPALTPVPVYLPSESTADAEDVRQLVARTLADHLPQAVACRVSLLLTVRAPAAIEAPVRKARPARSRP